MSLLAIHLSFLLSSDSSLEAVLELSVVAHSGKLNTQAAGVEEVLGVRGWPGLGNEFQGLQAHTVKPCLKQQRKGTSMEVPRS